ncbi:sensor histidine kinase family protein [Candidatus Venteria ishoeyi]|uniref:histidine kinase n=1 Tax=Candidatus Venteria ishoeyi TaxID=1899563 RepID=A0A1H6F7A5_9GAMM|nr:hypothetical protein [Candidatus Venteria ishoeyi]SEH06018.1 hybrid sensory histidine kinase BarA [Candidatus Venteria ishoeyi]
MIIKQRFTKKPRISFSERLTQAFLEDYQHVDKMMLILLFLHWFTASTIMAYAYGLYTLGFVGGGLVMLIATLAYMLYRGTVVFRIIVGISLMLFSAIFIQQHLGRIEMHFHVFIALAFLIRYKDFIPLLAGAITTTVHHAVFSYCQVYDITLLDMPIKVYNYGEGFSITLLHAAFVVLAVSVYIYMIQSLRQQFIKNIQFSDTLELKNQEIEQSKIALKKEKEREMAANKAKSQFIANMSHELRTPRFDFRFSNIWSVKLTPWKWG